MTLYSSLRVHYYCYHPHKDREASEDIRDDHVDRRPFDAALGGGQVSGVGILFGPVSDISSEEAAEAAKKEAYRAQQQGRVGFFSDGVSRRDRVTARRRILRPRCWPILPGIEFCVNNTAFGTLPVGNDAILF